MRAHWNVGQALFLTLLLGFSACGDRGSGGATDAGGATGDGGENDAGGISDGGQADAGGGDAGTADSGNSDGGSVADAGSGDAGGWGSDGGCFPVACQASTIYACANCLDDDGDGLIDALDPDCLGPCDNNEAGFATEIPGGQSPGCGRECYFDKDNGVGNDGCAWSSECDPLAPEASVGCSYDSNLVGGRNCALPQANLCHEVCLPLVPNGCDCFGCCELPAGSGRHVFIGTGVSSKNPSCTLAMANDDTACAPCTPQPDCEKSCGRCQLCVGKTQVPADCFGGGLDGGSSADAGASDGGSADGGINLGQCPGGEQACGLAGEGPCPSSYYCITGCCQFIIP